MVPEPYFSIIGHALASRSNNEFELDGKGQSMFLLALCRDLATACATAGAFHVSPDDIACVETMASGHSDYQRKLALYCHELATGRSGMKVRP